MLLGGLQKTSLIDFPGRVASTVFTVGCNWRCPFCHNKDLVSLEEFNKAGLRLIREKEFFKFLEKRKGVLTGVCITGGEPTLQPDLMGFCRKIKGRGLEVKLDTNGSNPRKLEELIKAKVVDFIAMDVKTDWSDYGKAVGVKGEIDKVKKSLRLIVKSGLEYELRTTVVPGVHDLAGLRRLAKELRQVEAELVWVWQQFRPRNCLDPAYLKKRGYSDRVLRGWLKEIVKILPKTRIRGG